jgi:hypothetical protein
MNKNLIKRLKYLNLIIYIQIILYINNNKENLMSSESIPFIKNLLQSPKDIVACLLNCSNNGICKNDSNENYFCSCFKYYSGNSCENDLRLCSKLKCLNNGTCLNIIINENSNNYDFNCQCEPFYYGKNCELKVNLCQNVTCSNKGVCYKNKTSYYCKCFKGYTGQLCQIESNQSKTIKTINNMSAYLSIVIFGLFFISILLLDICHYWNPIKRNIKNKKNITKHNLKFNY